MKFLKLTVLFILIAHCCRAQDTTIVVTQGMMDKSDPMIYLGKLNGWIFKQGTDTGYEKININTTGWTKLNPFNISPQYADKNGRVECWFRVRFQLDSSFSKKQIGFDFSPYAATELFIDGKLVASRGNTGTNGKPFSAYNGGLDAVIVDLESSSPHLLAIHFVGYLSPMPSHELMVKRSGIVFLTGPNYFSFLSSSNKYGFGTLFFCLSACAFLSILFWLLHFQNKQEKNLVWIAIFTSVLTLLICVAIGSNQIEQPYVQYLIFQSLFSFLFFVLVLLLLPLLLSKVFTRKLNSTLIWVLILFTVLNFVGSLTPQWSSFGSVAGVISTIFLLSVCIYYVGSSWRTLHGAQWAIVVGLIFLISTLLISTILQILFKNLANSQFYVLVNELLFILSFPLSLLVYVAMRFKEIITEVQHNANQVLQLSEEKKKQAEIQQEVLQEEVEKQTAEIRTTLDNLKATQSQLIQSEKMASLGELTAGIAHEIQNPLNFVNNFSEVSTEMIQEIKEERAKNKDDRDEALQDEILEYISKNLEKISQHGNRASSIVKGMLEHSRNSSGAKELTDINILADEYLKLSYHGLRAKDKSFNSGFETDLEENLPKIAIVPQDFGRVLLNLINNAFYAVNEKQKVENSIPNAGSYKPMVIVNSKKTNGKIEMSIKDNGNGIPQAIRDKIFQPFFTTKPTGKGTGLGLSLAYDIVKAHGGELKVETKEGEGSEFIIQLPIN